MTQEQVAERMGVSAARVSQIEGGDVSTQDVLNRFVAALGGTLKLIADFGDEQLKIARAGARGEQTTGDGRRRRAICGERSGWSGSMWLRSATGWVRWHARDPGSDPRSSTW
jgi:transcriptional regulator with XRE-family HTH domain